MRCAVLGSPINHSLSPVLHAAAYAELGLDWSYEAREVTSAELAGFLDGLNGAEGSDDVWRGLSLTMPLKRAVVPLLDDADDWVRLSGVANTVLLDRGEGTTAPGNGAERALRIGANTDIPGAVAAIEERVGPPRSAVVLGGGATAASVLLALAELGCTTTQLLVRSPLRASATVEVARRHPTGGRVDVLALDTAEVSADLVVSTIPVSAQSDDLLARVDAGAVFDVVYDPWPTPLARWAVATGAPVIDGLDLLAHQAALQVRLMTGSSVPVEVLRRAGRSELRRRGGVPVNEPGD